MFKLLTNNHGTVARALPVVIGLGLLGLALVGPRTSLGYWGIIPLVTALLASRPLYSLVRVSTRRRR